MTSGGIKTLNYPVAQSCHFVNVFSLQYFVQTLPDYMLLSELIITLTDRIGLFVHDKSHEYRVTETNYYVSRDFMAILS